MPTDVQTPPEPGLAGLIGGIVNDMQQLFHQQLLLVKTEIKQDSRRVLELTPMLLLAFLLAFVGLIVVSLGLAHVLSYAFPDLPLWGSMVIIGLVLMIAGGAVGWVVLQRFRSFNPLPDQSLAGLQENLEWKTTPTPK
jgi:uncharacterized membrane protein YqjE